MNFCAAGVRSSAVIGTMLAGSLLSSPQEASSVKSLPAKASNPETQSPFRRNETSEFTTIHVGKQPYGLAFDGTNLWVANFADDSVSKVRTNDGTVLGTFATGGSQPYGLVCDGSNIWVSNLASANVGKLRPAMESCLGRSPLVPIPAGWRSMETIFGFHSAAARSGSFARVMVQTWPRSRSAIRQSQPPTMVPTYGSSMAVMDNEAA